MRALALLVLVACSTSTTPSPPTPRPRLHVARADITRVIEGDTAPLGGSLAPNQPRASVVVRVFDPQGLLARAGLRDGDEVTAVAGLPLTLGNALVLHGRLGVARETSIAVKRHGKRVSWRVALD